MAGTAIGFQLKALHLQKSVSSIDSKLFGLRLRGCCSAASVKNCGLIGSSIVMRVNGGGGSGGSRGSHGGWRPPQKSDENTYSINKNRYELQQEKRDQQKKSRATRMDLKELKMGYRIEKHDYVVRLKAAKKFLADGDKVKIILNLKGHDTQFRNVAVELLKKFQAEIGELGREEIKNLKDTNLFIVMIPNKAALQKAQDTRKKDKQEIPEVSAGVNVPAVKTSLGRQLSQIMLQ